MSACVCVCEEGNQFKWRRNSESNTSCVFLDPERWIMSPKPDSVHNHGARGAVVCVCVRT